MPPDAPVWLRSAASDPVPPNRSGHAITNFFKRTWRADRNTLIINGHPDPRQERYCAALCSAYAKGMHASGRIVRRIDAGKLALPGAVALAKQHFGDSALDLDSAIELIGRARHLIVVYPLWLNRAPLPLQHLLSAANDGCRIPLRTSHSRLRANKTFRAIVTMDMPAFAYRSASCPTACLEDTSLPLPDANMKPPIFIGCVNTISDGLRKRWLAAVYELGLAGR